MCILRVGSLPGVAVYDDDDHDHHHYHGADDGGADDGGADGDGISVRILGGIVSLRRS